jgi:hypothetical protein
MDHYTLTHLRTGDVDVFFGYYDEVYEAALDWSVEQNGDAIVISNDDETILKSVEA